VAGLCVCRAVCRCVCRAVCRALRHGRARGAFLHVAPRKGSRVTAVGGTLLHVARVTAVGGTLLHAAVHSVMDTRQGARPVRGDGGRVPGPARSRGVARSTRPPRHVTATRTSRPAPATSRDLLSGTGHGMRLRAGWAWTCRTHTDAAGPVCVHVQARPGPLGAIGRTALVTGGRDSAARRSQCDLASNGP
jgi:hypothetical protein